MNEGIVDHASPNITLLLGISEYNTDREGASRRLRRSAAYCAKMDSPVTFVRCLWMHERCQYVLYDTWRLKQFYGYNIAVEDRKQPVRRRIWSRWALRT